MLDFYRRGLHHIFKVLQSGTKKSFGPKKLSGIGTGNDKVKPLLPGVTYLYPWKHQETFRFSDVFRGCRSAKPGYNGLNLFQF